MATLPIRPRGVKRGPAQQAGPRRHLALVPTSTNITRERCSNLLVAWGRAVRRVRGLGPKLVRVDAE